MKFWIMQIYDFELWRWHFTCDPIKQKHSMIIRNLLERSRLQNQIEFDTYAILTFSDEDSLLKYPHIESIDTFSKSKTNCLIYNLKYTDENPGVFNKLFITFYQGKHISYYGYMMYNTETKKFNHKYFVSAEFGELAVSLNKSFHSIKRWMVA